MDLAEGGREWSRVIPVGESATDVLPLVPCQEHYLDRVQYILEAVRKQPRLAIMVGSRTSRVRPTAPAAEPVA